MTAFRVQMKFGRGVWIKFLDQWRTSYEHVHFRVNQITSRFKLQ